MKVNWKFHKSSDKLLRPPWKVGILSGGEHNLRLKRSVVFHVKQINLTGHKNTYFSRRKKSISKWVSDWKKNIVLGLFGHLATKMKKYNIWYNGNSFNWCDGLSGKSELYFFFKSANWKGGKRFFKSAEIFILTTSFTHTWFYICSKSFPPELTWITWAIKQT